MSPVNQTGLRQGWHNEVNRTQNQVGQTDLNNVTYVTFYPRLTDVISNNTDLTADNLILFPSAFVSDSVTVRTHYNTRHGACLHSAAAQHGNLPHWSVRAGRVTLFILPTQKLLKPHLTQRKTRERFVFFFLGGNGAERTERVEIRAGNIPGSRQSMHGYILTDSTL